MKERGQEEAHVAVIERYGEVDGRDAYAWRCSCGDVLAPRWASTSLAWVETDAEAHQRKARRSSENAATSDRPACTACSVPIHRGSVYLHNDRPYHVPCLVRSLEGESDAIREQHEQLRPHVRDRSVLRGLCQMADAAEAERGGRQRRLNEDERAALDWLRETAGYDPCPK